MSWILWILGVPAAIVVLFLLYMVVAITIQYRRFRSSPTKTWADEVLALMQKLVAAIAEDQEFLTRANRDEADAVAVLREAHFSEHLSKTPVDALLDVNGVGPATLESIRNAGYASLRELRIGGYDEVPGVGARRAADIQRFVSGRLRREEMEFDLGLGGPGAAFKAAEQKCRAEFAVRKHGAAIRREVLEEARVRFLKFRPYVESCTFENFLASGGRFDPEVERFQRELVPTIEQLVKQAELIQKQTAPGRSDETQSPLTNGRTASGSRVASSAATSAPEDPEVVLRGRCDSIVAVLCAAARADGRLAKSEMQTIRRLATSRLGSDAGIVNLLELSLAQYSSGAIDLDFAVGRLRAFAAVEERRALLADVRAVLEASGKPLQRKAKFLRKVAEGLGVASTTDADLKTAPPAAAKAPGSAASAPASSPVSEAAEVRTPAEPRKRSPKDIEAAHRIALEIPAEVELSADLVRRQHRLLMEKFNPEKARAFGTDIEMAVAAKREAAVAAATALMQRWGEPLEPPQPEVPADIRHNPDLDTIFGG